jgi:peptidoglycan/LPS O-acetylase OafA/YrhL
LSGQAYERTRLLSLHYMRGFAALLVVYAHICVVGITDREAPHLYLPMIHGAPVVPSQRAAADIYLRPEMVLNAHGMISGEIGVLLFFLISGFVIRMSLGTSGPVRFLVRRAFRIYPLDITVVCATALVFSLYSRAYGLSGPYTPLNTLTSSLLVSGWFGMLYTMPLIWTLMVEVCFYATMAFCAYAWRDLRYGHLLLIGAICLLLAYIGVVPPAELVFAALPLRYAGYNGMYIIFMLIGAALWQPDRGRRCGGQCILTVLVLGAMFMTAHSIFADHVFMTGVRDRYSGAAAFVIFVAALACERWMRESRLPSFFGDISYPLYLVHVPLSWAIVFELTRRHVSVHLAFASALLASIALAWVLHVLIERPSHRWGKRITAPRRHEAMEYGGMAGLGA